MDVLSEVLKVVKLEGAVFFNGEFTAPWCLRSSGSTGIATYLSPEAGHLIPYHYLTEGRAYARLLEGKREELTAGKYRKRLEITLGVRRWLHAR